LAVEGRLLIHRGFTGHACRPHEKSGLAEYWRGFWQKGDNAQGNYTGYETLKLKWQGVIERHFAAC
ncbi:hypothetical protein OD783_33915, partial [Pseudomonas aeruginosa]